MLKKIFKFILVSSFFSYYLVAFALNYPAIDSKIKPLKLLDKEYLVELNSGVYLSTYPTYNDLKSLKSKYNIKRVVTLLNPNFPISRELVKAEKDNCKKLGIEFISPPINLDSNIMNLNIIKDFTLSKDNILINSYYYDKKMKIIKRVLST